jgi:hypothetical protein
MERFRTQSLGRNLVPGISSLTFRLRLSREGQLAWFLRVEQLTLNQRVPGSSPGAPTNQSPQTARFRHDVKQGVSAGISGQSIPGFWSLGAFAHFGCGFWRVLELFRIESERLKLPAPFGRRIAEPLDANAARQATFYGRFD